MDLKQLKTDIAARLETILAARGVPDVPSADALANMLEYPPDPSMGDLAFPCFRLSKLLRQAPPAIAQSLQNEMVVPGISRIETVGGYLNFFVDERALTAQTLSDCFRLFIPQRCKTVSHRPFGYHGDRTFSENVACLFWLQLCGH